MGKPGVLPIAGAVVSDIDLTYSLTFTFDGRVLRIGSDMTSRATPVAVNTVVACGDDPVTDIDISGFTGARVTEATYDETGLLTIQFDTGASISVPPNPDFEAWEYAGGGDLVVALPGGELAIWGTRPPPSD